MNYTEIALSELQDRFIEDIQKFPLDDFIDRLEAAVTTAAPDLADESLRNFALTLREFKARDYASLADPDVETGGLTVQ
jgi:hypothetical protein